MPLHSIEGGNDPAESLKKGLAKIQRKESVLTVIPWSNGWLIVTEPKGIETR